MRFRVLPTAFDRIRKRIIIQTSVIVVLVGVIVIAPGLFSDDGVTRQSTAMTGMIFVLIFVVVIFTRIKKQKERYLSLVLTIEDNAVTREMMDMPMVKIAATDISKIIRARTGLVICGSKRTDQIVLPLQMENYDEMIAALGMLKPITENNKNYSYISILTLIGVIALMIGDFLVKDRIVNILSYGITILLISACFVFVQISPLVQKTTKRIFWIVLIPLFSMLMILIDLIKS